MAYTTLNRIKEYEPCGSGWKRLLKFLGKDKADNRRLSFKRILKSNGIHDAIWALRTLPYEDKCLFLADVAESVLHIYEKRNPDDDRPRKAIQAVRDYKVNGITREQLNKARAAAAAVADAYAAYAADVAVAYAAYAADVAVAYAAYAADVAVADAADDAAYAAADAAYAAADAAYAADAARKKKWQEIEILFIEHFC